MAPRIVLFGATGYTGRLTARALIERGARPVLAGRDQAKLSALAEGLQAELETVVADVGRPDSVRRLLSEGDVLISTVGPFVRWGAPAVEATIDAKAIYLDSTGEQRFVRQIFQRYGPQAAASGAALVTAFGYDFVPGNLVGALALRDAGPEATRVEIGYFARGSLRRGVSAGTLATGIGIALEPMHGFRDGRITRVQGATHAFPVGRRRRRGVSIGGTEQFALPRLYPQVRDISVYLGPAPPLAGGFAKAAPWVAVLPGVRRGADMLVDRVIRSANRDPAASLAAMAVAEAYDVSGRLLSTVSMSADDVYEFTAGVLAWGAVSAVATGVAGTGALGPVDAFGLDELTKGCAEAGLIPI